jgi:hypothetical protein
MNGWIVYIANSNLTSVIREWNLILLWSYPATVSKRAWILKLKRLHTLCGVF